MASTLTQCIHGLSAEFAEFGGKEERDINNFNYCHYNIKWLLSN